MWPSTPRTGAGRGLGATEWVLIVDPIDGTRPAMAGLESACVSVAAARVGDGEPAMGEVEVGCVVEIKSGAVFQAAPEGGVEPRPRLSANTDLARLFWSYGFRGRPVVPTGAGARGAGRRLVGGRRTFDLGSATFDMTRIVTGQLDAYVEPGPRLVADVPGMREEFERVGGGALLNNSPYDLAAAAADLRARAGAIVTDAYGNPLSDRPLLGSGRRVSDVVRHVGEPRAPRPILAAIDRGGGAPGGGRSRQ